MKKVAILIIEDDKSIRETLTLALEMEGYRVMTAAHGREGILALQSNEPPCLVLLDLEMPVMDGLAFLQEKSAEASIAAIPVVVISATPEKAKGSGANQVLKKPIDHDLLMSVVKKYCKSP